MEALSVRPSCYQAETGARQPVAPRGTGQGGVGSNKRQGWWVGGRRYYVVEL